MNRIKVALKRNKKIEKIILISILVSFIISFLLFKKTDCKSILEELKNMEFVLKNNHIAYIIPHFLIICIFITFSILPISKILFLIYIFYELICSSFNIICFSSLYGFGGLIFSFIYLFLTKGIYLALCILLFIKVQKFTKNIMMVLKNKETLETKQEMSISLKHIGIIFLIVFINDLFVYFFAHKILLKCLFLLK